MHDLQLQVALLCTTVNGQKKRVTTCELCDQFETGNLKQTLVIRQTDVFTWFELKYFLPPNR